MEDQKPHRVLIIISNENTHWEQSWFASEDICLVALEVLEEKKPLKHIEHPKPRVLAKQKWGVRVFLVFDILNASYDPAMGHLPEHNKLSVSIVRLDQKTDAYPASPPIQNRVNKDIAEAHNYNGINSHPPFVWDYNDGPPTYTNVRNISLLL